MTTTATSTTTSNRKTTSSKTPEEPLSVTERMAAGKELRSSVPRSSHANWEPASGRPDPLALVQADDASRLEHLLPVRYGRMMESPFTFYRATAVVMASDLAPTPRSGLIAQLSGDAHCSNFGGYATLDRTLVFDLNDFDETLPGPWEWDIKRLATSIVLASRENGFTERQCADAARATVKAYRERMNELAQVGHLAVWYSRITAAEITASLPTKSAQKSGQRWVKKAQNRDQLQSFDKLTTVVDGRRRIADDPPIIEHISEDAVDENLPRFAMTYRTSLRDDVSALLDRYTFVDFARKVVGVGSVGTRCYVVLMRGIDDGDPLFLQIKEAGTSVLEPYLGQSKYKNHGQRVVRGQHAIQAGSDIFLGWGHWRGIDFYVRQLRDMKASIDLTIQTPERMAIYGALCGQVLARAHARTGDSAMIAGYLGQGDAFDDAIASFAKSYADQTERDHAAFVAAVKSGKVKATISS